MPSYVAQWRVWSVLSTFACLIACTTATASSSWPSSLISLTVETSSTAHCGANGVRGARIVVAAEVAVDGGAVRELRGTLAVSPGLRLRPLVASALGAADETLTVLIKEWASGPSLAFGAPRPSSGSCSRASIPSILMASSIDLVASSVCFDLVVEGQSTLQAAHRLAAIAHAIGADPIPLSKLNSLAVGGGVDGFTSVLRVERGGETGSLLVASMPADSADSSLEQAVITRSTRLPGLHRLQTLQVEVPNLRLPLACGVLKTSSVQLGAVITLPQHAYVDMDEARALGRGHIGASHVDSGPRVSSPEAFIDVERPTASSSQHTIAVWRTLRMVQLPSDGSQHLSESFHDCADAGVSVPEAVGLDAMIRRPGAEAGVAASLDPGSAWVTPFASDSSSVFVSLNVTLRLPVHVRYQAPGCESDGTDGPVECYAPASLPAPELVWRLQSLAEQQSPSVTAWERLTLDDSTACSYAAASGETSSIRTTTSTREVSAGDIVEGHSAFVTVAGNGLTVDIMAAVPVGSKADEIMVATWTVAATATAASIVVISMIGTALSG